MKTGEQKLDKPFFIDRPFIVSDSEKNYKNVFKKSDLLRIQENEKKRLIFLNVYDKFSSMYLSSLFVEKSAGTAGNVRRA